MNISKKSLETYGYLKIDSVYFSDDKNKLKTLAKELYATISTFKISAFSTPSHYGALDNKENNIASGLRGMISAIAPEILSGMSVSRDRKKSFERMWKSLWTGYSIAADWTRSELEMFSTLGLKLPFVYAAVILRDETAIQLVNPENITEDLELLLIKSYELLQFFSVVEKWYTHIHYNTRYQIQDVMIQLVKQSNFDFVDSISGGESIGFSICDTGSFE